MDWSEKNVRVPSLPGSIGLARCGGAAGRRTQFGKRRGVLAVLRVILDLGRRQTGTPG
ncbi:MAG TPA: hypothetical protein VKJ01_02035 [Candidatus Solibacter sp.]|nr:hypothetical protein [Candidatus Solibacter sp.]